MNYKLFSIVLSLSLLVGCASGQSTRKVQFGSIGGDFIMRNIGDGSQMPVPGGTDVNLDAEVPIEGVPIPISLDVSRAGLLSTHDLSVERVEGTVILEAAFTGMQGIDLPACLERTFTPSNPFTVNEEELTYELPVASDE